MEFKQAASHILDIVYEVTLSLSLFVFLSFCTHSLFSSLHTNCSDTFESSSTRTLVGEQETKAAKPLSTAQLSAKHQTSVQLVGESRRSVSQAQSKHWQEFDASQDASLVSREFRQSFKSKQCESENGGGGGFNS